MMSLTLLSSSMPTPTRPSYSLMFPSLPPIHSLPRQSCLCRQKTTVYWYFSLYYINFVLTFIISLSIVFGLVCYCFFKNSRCILKLFMCDLSDLFNVGTVNYKLSSWNYLSYYPWTSGKLCFHFNLILEIYNNFLLIFLMTHWPFQSAFFSLQAFVLLPLFLVLFISSFTQEITRFSCVC